MKPAHLLRPARKVRPRTLRRQALRRMLRALRRGRGLRPLVSALVSALPMVALHPAAVAGSFPRGVVRAIAPPPPLAVPTPGTDWLQQGSATNNHPQALATGQMQVDQASTRAIYRWSRFDIGSRASLTINTPNGGSSLNLVSGGDVSRIFGSLVSNGEVYLINPSGIWFGQGASVNVAGLFASTLQLDAADYMAGLANSLRSAAPTFTWQDVKDADGAVLQTFDHPSNFVHVDSGAALTTPSGGRVFLLAREATNAGRIETPGGQTVVAAGSEVYLQAPSTDTSPLYASEANAKVPATRGLLVEVGGGASGEVATNLGEILAARGNVTLVGLAVNQSGRVSATTSVQENGSVFLLARSGATALNDNGSIIKRANVGGQLTLGAGSRIDITPEASAATSTDSSAFTRSRVELSGQTIELQSGAVIRAPGAIVNARAADVPAYETAAADLPASPTARIVLGEGTTIDVSGTTDAQVSAARNYVSTELIGQADLADAPLQKLGPLYQKSGVVFDIREDVPILGLQAGDAANPYVQNTARTATERLASGGTINLESAGLVAAHATSRLNVSGGQVTYTGATVPGASVLVAADGTRYTLNEAPVDLVYRSLEGYAEPSVDRFGTNAPAGANLQGRWDPGYVEGRAAGTVSVTAPVALLDGQMSAGTLTGVRQAAGLDPLAAAGTLSLGRTTAGGDRSAAMDSLAITAAPAATDAADLAFWADPLAAAVTGQAGQPLASRISALQIRNAGFGKLNVAAEGRIEQQAGADLLLPDQSSVTLRSRLGDVALNASTVTRGGAVAVTAGYGTTAQSGPGAPAITLAAGQRIDVAGNWVNRWRDGADARAAVKGGSIALKAGGALTLGTGSVLDASGGATLAANGSTVKGTAAGSIVLESNNGSASDQALAPLTLGGELRAYGWGPGQGGSLRVKAGEVLIQAADAAPRSDGATLVLGDSLFQQGGFAAYDIEGVRSLTVADGATVAPRTAAWLGRAGLRNVASGTDMARVLATGMPLDGRLSPVKLTLQSRGSSNVTTLQGEGALRLAGGARIQADPRSTITLVGGNSLVVEGDIASAGGSVSLSLAGRNSGANEPFAGTLRVAGTAEIDVSGTTLITPDGDRYNQGQVLAGGSITVSTTTGDGAAGTRTLIDIEDGAALRANGAAGVLDLPRAVGATGPAIARNQMVASNGGSITVSSREGGAYLGGSLEARAGQIQGADGRTVRGEGGTLTVGITGSSRDGTIVGAVPEVAVVLQQAAPTRADIAPGTVTVSADRLQAGGFADVHLASADRIVLQGDITYATAGTLSLDAPVLTARQAAQAGQAAAAAQRVNLSAATALRLGSSTRIGASQPLPDSGPTTGTAQLAFSGGLMELFGDMVVQGAQQLGFAGSRELRLRGVALETRQTGSLRAAADVTFSAPQVAPTTATHYTVDLTGEDGTAQHTLRVTGGDAASAAPLSAAGVFTAKAADIELDGGVIRAPFGQVDLQATRSITVQGDSLISVSGNGLAVPYGGTLDGGKSWSYNGNPIEAPLAKSVTLAAPGQTVQLLSGEIDLSGGGQMLGWEFVPGPGGSTDIFTGASGAYAIVPSVTGYAPHDAAIAATQGGTTLGGALALGQQITVGEGGPLPAGTYALLPARYALLPGAFLVSPQGRTPTTLGYTQVQPNGSYVIGAVTSRVGSTANNQVATAWSITASSIARRSSEVRTTDTDSFFAAQAAKAGTAAPRLARDAGALNIEALSLALESVNRFAVQDALSRGGSLNISSERIHVAGAGAPAVAGALNLSVDQLNATGAYSLMLGGRRGASTDAGAEVQVTAREVTVDTRTGPALQAGDIVLAATEKVDVATGSRLTAREQAGTAEQLAFSGDGALLRVAEDADAASVRTGAMGSIGDLSLGAGVALSGGSVTVEATRDLSLDPSATLAADTINVGARRIDVAPAAGNVSAGVQAGTANLAAQLAGARRVALRGFEGITLAAGTQLGSDRLARITLDTSSLRAGAGASVKAGGINLTNTTGVAPGEVRESGQGALTLQANGQAGGDGHVQITGAQAIDGVQQVRLAAAGSVVVGRGAQLSTGGDLLLNARTLTAATGAAPNVADTGLSTERALPQLQAGGVLSLSRPGADDAQAAPAQAGIGAHVILAADRIEQGGTIDLPTARLELHAAGSAGGPAVVFQGETRNAEGNVVTPGSQTLLPGVVRSYDGQAVAAPAGQLIVKAANGDVVAEAGSVIDVSAAVAPASAGGGAGSVDIAAPAGEVTLDGRLLATSGGGQTAGSLSVDSLRALNLAALAARIADERDAARELANFGAALNLRNRSGDQTVATGTVLQAQQIALTTDAGALTVAGTLQAGAGDSLNAGGVRLQAAGDVTLTSGARVSANASAVGQTGGTVFIGTQQGRIALQGGAVVEARGVQAADGTLKLRAPRTGVDATNRAGTDVAVDAIAADVSRVGGIEVEAFKSYDAATINSTASVAQGTVSGGASGTVNTVAEAEAFASRSAAIVSRLTAGMTAAQRDKLALRAGIDIASQGDLTLANAWNLTRFSTSGGIARAGGQPINLTLRAAGNLLINASLSDGFKAAGATNATTARNIAANGVIVGEQGSDLRLVGGADLSSADVLATVAAIDSGDVKIGRSGRATFVRTTTGDIDIAAGRDVVLDSRQAVVYSSGVPVSVEGFAGLRFANESLSDGTVKQSPFLDGSGSVSISALRDVVGGSNGNTPYLTNWWWRSTDSDGQALWYTRYDQFEQGFASFGGGDVRVSAGRDALQVQLAAPETGLLLDDGATRLMGGDVSLSAGRQVVAGMLIAGGDEARVTAARIVALPNPDDLTPGDALQVLHGDTAVTLQAREGMVVGRVGEAGMVTGARQGTRFNPQLISGLAPSATLTATTTAGDLSYRVARPANIDGLGSGSNELADSAWAAAAPRVTRLAAMSGDLAVSETLTVNPATSADVQLFAQGSVAIDGLALMGGTARQASVTYDSWTPPSSIFGDVTRPLWSAGQVAPLRVVAQQGAITYGGDASSTFPVELAVPLRFIAAQGITAYAAITAQHQGANDLSLMQAGGDIVSANTVGESELVRLHGPGDLVVMAGGDIDLGLGAGIVALGNQENSLLSRGSATVHVLAGVDPRRGDYAQAGQRYFAVLAGGLAGVPQELAVQIEAARGLAPGSSADDDALLARARSLAGQAAYDAALLRAMQREVEDLALNPAQAQAAFDALPATQRALMARQVAGDLLAATWLATIPAAEQPGRVLTLAAQQSGGAQRVADLRAFVARRTGGDPGSDAAALVRFAALPLEQQILALNPVLERVVTDAGKAAAQAQGTAKTLAYAPAYQALAEVFPQAAATADLLMGSSQIASRQGSALHILSPHGGINVGELTASSNKSASQLGVVTLGGSAEQPAPIHMLVRDDIAVNQSRVFSVDEGDVLMWSSTGNLDAGRGAKTVTGAPAPVYSIDSSGKVQVDVSSAFSGSGIAVLDADSTLYLFAPRGEINTGDAGIQSAGAAFIDAVRVVGPSLQVAGPAVGLPAAPAIANTASSLGGLGQSATAAGQAAPAAGERTEDAPRRNLSLDFVAFGSGEITADPTAAGPAPSTAPAAADSPREPGDDERRKKRSN